MIGEVEGDEAFQTLQWTFYITQLGGNAFVELEHVVVDQIKQQILFGCHVVVERALSEADLCREIPKAHCLIPMGIDELQPFFMDGAERLWTG